MKDGGGTAILVHNTLKFKNVIIKNVPPTQEVFEYSVCEVIKDNISFLVLSIYRNPESCPKLFFSKFENLLVNIKNKFSKK